MLSWFQALLPKEAGFFDLFERHAETLVAGAAALRTMLDGGDGVAAACREIKRQEKFADDIAAETLNAARRTFITPFDRSDIRHLAVSLDDAIDQMHQTGKAVLLYEFGDFSPAMRHMGDIVVRAAALTRESLPLLKAMSRNAVPLASYAEQILKMEDEADAIHDQGLKELFRLHRNADPMGFIVGAEIYGHLEKVVDGFEDVANRVTAIVIEHS